MQRRTWVIRFGDHWFLRYIRDLYETLASKYTTPGQSRGIVSIFSKGTKSPFWFRKKEEKEDLDFYFKDRESKESFSKIIQEDTALKIYIVGTSRYYENWLTGEVTYRNSLYSLSKEGGETGSRLTPETLAKSLHVLFEETKIKASAINPIKISLICGEIQNFPQRLLEELHQLGHQHVLIKERTGSVSPPVFGKKYSSGIKHHYYLDGTNIYSVQRDQDMRWSSIKTLKKCYLSTKIKSKQTSLKDYINQIGKLGYLTNTEGVRNLKEIMHDAMEDSQIKAYRYGTAWYMRLFNLLSNTEKSLISWNKQFGEEECVYSTIKAFNA